MSPRILYQSFGSLSPEISRRGVSENECLHVQEMYFTGFYYIFVRNAYISWGSVVMDLRLIFADCGVETTSRFIIVRFIAFTEGCSVHSAIGTV